MKKAKMRALPGNSESIINTEWIARTVILGMPFRKKKHFSLKPVISVIQGLIMRSGKCGVIQSTGPLIIRTEKRIEVQLAKIVIWLVVTTE